MLGLIVLSIAFGVTVSTLKSSPGGGGGSGTCDDCTNVCLTESCIEAASFILGNINRSVDPCEDFYNFTCGAWAQKTVIPTGIHIYTCMYMYMIAQTSSVLQLMNK